MKYIPYAIRATVGLSLLGLLATAAYTALLQNPHQEIPIWPVVSAPAGLIASCGWVIIFVSGNLLMSKPRFRP